MGTKTSAQKKARFVQKETGYPYVTCLRLTRGELVFQKRVDGCLVATAMALADAHPVAGPHTKTVPCTCPRCDP